MLKPRLQFGCPHANGFSSTKMKSDINFNADKIDIIYILPECVRLWMSMLA